MSEYFTTHAITGQKEPITTRCFKLKSLPEGFQDIELIVHKSADGCGWDVTHVLSGGRVTCGWVDKETAQKIAVRKLEIFGRAEFDKNVARLTMCGHY